MTRSRLRGPGGSTSSPGRLSLVTDGPRISPTVPDDLRLPPRSRGVDQMSRATCPVIEDPRGQQTLQGDSRLGARGRGVDQLSWETLACARSHTGSINVLGDLGPDSSARGFDQLSWVTWPRVQMPAQWINFPGRFGPVSMGPWCRPTVLGVSGQGPRAAGSTNTPAHLTHVSQGRGVDQLSQITRAHARGRAGWTSCPVGIGLVSEGPRCGPALPGDTLSGPNVREVNQLSRVTRPQVRWPVL